jgi:hypothetical protein
MAFLSHSNKCLTYYLKIGRDRLLLHVFQFIIPCLPTNRRVVEEQSLNKLSQTNFQWKWHYLQFRLVKCYGFHSVDVRRFVVRLDCVQKVCFLVYYWHTLCQHYQRDMSAMKTNVLNI